jgi:hypothetical protein
MTAKRADPVGDELGRELRLFRRGDGYPSPSRMSGLFYLTEALGDGIPERAFDELAVLQRDHGADPLTSIGAFFYLSGWGVGLGTVDQRRRAYVDAHLASDVSTPWRRSERGIAELVTLVRDRDEHARPWAFVSVFQSGNRYQPVLDFNLREEAWTAPSVSIDGEPVDFDFHVHKHPTMEGVYTRRVVLPESPLKLDVGFAERMAVIRVGWNMPIWPVWSVFSWTADPRIAVHLRTFRERAVEVSLQWWRHDSAAAMDGLVTDGAIWAERRDPNTMNLPDGWQVT